MKIFAMFDDQGFPTGFYPEDIYSEQPEGTTEITETQWQEFLENQEKRRWDAEKSEVVEYVYTPTVEEVAAAVRADRDARLKKLDSIVSNPLRWAEFSDELKQAFAEYRRALLDLPEQTGFPYEIIFPDMPKI